MVNGSNVQPVKGNIIIYFKKDSTTKSLGYGSQIVFNKPLQPIKNSGNPGAFNYERYAALQVLLLYGLITAMACWLLQKNKTAFITSLVCLLGFISLRTYSFITARQQQQLIVYNVPKHQAIDFISGRNYFFEGDEELLLDNFLQNFHLKPSRILHRMNAANAV